MPDDFSSEAAARESVLVKDAAREGFLDDAALESDAVSDDSGSERTGPRGEKKLPPVPGPHPRRRRDLARHWVAGFGLLLFLGCALALVFRAPPATLPVAAPSSQTPARKPSLPAGAVVVLDPGHGGADSGAVAFGMTEKELTLDIVRRVAALLERQRVPIRLTRDTDRYVPLAARARFANALPNAVFVSVHLNHATNAPASGIETFYTERKEPLLALNLLPAVTSTSGAWQWLARLFGASPAGASSPEGAAEPSAVTESRALAEHIQAKLVSRTAAVDRGVKERGLYVTRHVVGPAVLVEGGFVSNPAEARALADPAYRQRVAESIADGIIEYLSNAASRGRVPPKNVLALIE